ncbi:uncharacterized protein LOC106137250 [Amyelois transitella]|uniref:uncharacterized protein LOC106137250 n=1 Tax=Amyelois transitella TaxID=680683 RepID=UPI00067AE2B4|nr:uncharacterized protein LOC106137250 [Amyelois transitella]
MLPSMPILFSRESQDAFGNKLEPSTSFFSQHSLAKPVINPEPPPLVIAKETPKAVQNEAKTKSAPKKKEDPPKIKADALETALVRSYYTKVQSRFASNPSVPTNKFVQFQNILKSFDPSKESPVDLYRKIEELFGEQHSDIVEEFLLFLRPEQAAEVGRFMDHFALMHMTGFIELLQKSFSRKPTVLRKIMRAITTAVNSGQAADLKTRVLPHLRAHPRLAQMFTAMFMDERPPDSAYESGVDILNENFLTNDEGCDVWEFQGGSHNKKKLDAKEGLDTMYLHGRVFLQHGRLLRSTRVTFPYSKEPYRVHARRLAPDHCHLSPPDSEEERSSPKRSRAQKIPPKKTKKQLKSPTKTAKDVNDNTKVKETVATVMNSPKNAKGKLQNNTKKNLKEKRDDKVDVIPKRDRKDSKHNVCAKIEVSKAKQAKLDPIPIEIKTEIKSNSWTRDEDKTMLQVIKGEASSDQMFGRISELLPHRSVPEIKERFCHVMTLLRKMAVGEVT